MGVCSLLFRCSLSCQWSGHSGSCQGEAVLHASAPAPMSNFTLEWICAEHANSHITKQIKSARKARGVCLRVCACVCERERERREGMYVCVCVCLGPEAVLYGEAHCHSCSDLCVQVLTT